MLVNLGRAALRDGRSDEAEGWFRRALVVRPEYPLALAGVGSVLAARQDFAGAIEWHQRAVARVPELADARADLADVLAKAGRIDEALHEYAAAAALDPAFGFEWGNLLFRSGDAATAIDAWRAALAAHPEWNDTRDNVAVALLALGRPAEAVAELQEIVRRDAGHQRAQFHLGLALAALGRRDEAANALRIAVSLRPDDADAAKALAEVEAAP